MLFIILGLGLIAPSPSAKTAEREQGASPTETEPLPLPPPFPPDGERSPLQGSSHSNKRASRVPSVEAVLGLPGTWSRHSSDVLPASEVGLELMDTRSLYLPCTFPVPSLYLPC